MAAVELYKQDGDYFQGVNKASCGYKLLAAMGWQEGEGLVRMLANSAVHGTYHAQGAQKQGIKSHVKVKKKVDNAGVGKARVGALCGRIVSHTRHLLTYRAKPMPAHATGRSAWLPTNACSPT